MIRPIDEAELAAQRRDIAAVRSLLDADYAASGRRRAALIETYGCQQNEADSDRMRGMLTEMGFDLAKDRQQADLILFNTCAVREHAELKVFGNIGALKAKKARNKDLILGITGCMMQQQHRVDEIMAKYPHVDFILGTGTFFRLPGAVLAALSGGERQRLGLARTFLHNAPLLLLDEPTSNLDSLNEAVILKSLREERENKTVVLVSHRQSTMRIADKVYSVEHGRMS